MAKLIENQIQISVRNMVEFLLRSGDIDNRRKGRKDVDAMAAGARIHRKIQGRMGGGYQAEVALKHEFPVEEVVIVLDGRADGIFRKDDIPFIDEIKGVYWDIWKLAEPVPVHRAQALCYAHMYLLDHPEEERIGIQLTYVDIETEEVRRFEEVLTREETEQYVGGLLTAYGNWGMFLYEHRQKRNKTLKELEFPFAYRPGQKELAANAFRTFSKKKKLFIQAPTGIGKTMAVLYPAVRALGEQLGEKVFYLTAKTITRTVANEAATLLQERGAGISAITFTAKEKLCPMAEEGKPGKCNPEDCPYAKGHYDRVNEAVFDYIHQFETAGREELLTWAEKYQVCPHELSLDLSLWFDVIICDYNYVFDPNVQLKRYFQETAEDRYLFLIDEAHNLPERAREMYSAAIYKEEFLAAARLVKPFSPKLERLLKRCNKLMLELKRECETYTELDNINHMLPALTAVYAEMEHFMEEFRVMDDEEEFGNLYLNLRHFINMSELMDDSYVIYTEHLSRESFMLKLYCVNPAKNLADILERGASVFFSATLLPVNYYKELLCGNTEEYAIYVPSPFDREKRFLAVGQDVSSRYKRRSEKEYERILDYILAAARSKKGNYLVFFPSYQFMNAVYDCYLGRCLGREEGSDVEIAVQTMGMTEKDREDFLGAFEEEKEKTFAAFCVMGGIFSEGIDLVGEKLIGVLVVGTGLPQVCTEREILKKWYDGHGHDGFAYAYRYPGMNKVLQAAGRVIRTDTDEGIILLLDDRFTYSEYRRLFPREWDDCRNIRYPELGQRLAAFWEKERK